MAKPGEISSLRRRQQGLLLSSEDIHRLSHVFDRFVVGVGNAVESPEAFIHL